jgi:cation transport ATPase
MICEKCGQQLNDESKFCTACGAKIETVQAVQETAAVSESTVTPVQEEVPEVLQEAVVEPIQASPSPVLPEQPQAATEPQTPTTTVPQAQAATVQQPAKTTPLPVWKYIGIFLLTSIPIVGAIMILVWSFGSSFNKNTQNYARAVFILFVISFILSIVGVVLYWEAVKYLIDSLSGFQMYY